MATGRIGVTPTLGTRWSKAPAGGTTALSGLDDSSVSLVYSVGYEQVYRNGVLLSRGNDYTATSGTSITLIDATITGDIIEVFANELVPLTDAISKGQFTAKGTLLSASAASTPAVLGVGSNDQVLTADSTTTTGLKWATPAAGGMTLISETVASGLSSLSFSSLGSYKQIYLVWDGIQHSTGSTAFGIRLNNSSSTIYPYMQWGEDNNLGTTQSLDTNYSYIGDSPNERIPFGHSVTSSTNSDLCRGWFKVDNYTSSSKYKFWETRYSYKVSTTTTKSYYDQGTFLSTSAITSIDIVRITGSATFSNLSNYSIRLYGVS